ncbi:MAG: hypothetical protein ACREE7_05030, partial [Dongiaceae bacterium]
QGYVLGIGRAPATIAGLMARALMIAGGVLLAAPSPRLTGLSMAANMGIGAALAFLGLAMLSLNARRVRS